MKDMRNELKRAFEAEMATAHRLMKAGRLSQALTHLERAHVLGQNYVIPHARSHWAMLRIAVKRGSAGAVWGQVARIVLGTLGSMVGAVPIGNTGGTDISMFARLPIEPEIAELINRKVPLQ